MQEQAEQRPEPSTSRAGDRLPPPTGSAMKRFLKQTIRPPGSDQDDRIEPAPPVQQQQEKGKGKARSVDPSPLPDADRDPGGLYKRAMERADELGLKLPSPQRAGGRSLLGKLLNDKFYKQVKPQLRRDAALLQAGLFGLGVPPLTAAQFRTVLLAGVQRRIRNAPMEKAASYLQKKMPDTATLAYQKIRGGTMFETKNIAFGQETSGKDTGTYLRAEHSGRVYSKGADAVAEGAEGDYRAVLKARVHGAGGPRAAAVKIASDQGLDNELYIYSILPELDIFSRIRDAFEREVPSDTPREVMLFMEREARTLSDLGQALDNPELKRTVAHKVVSAVNTLHKVSVEKVAPSGIVHLDIKPSNFMLSSEGKVKIYDFGFAQVNDDEIRQPWDHLPGTPKYMEPNAVTTRFWDFSLKQADLFSVGATLYELAHGRAPDENFPGYSDAELHRITGDGPIDSLEKVAALLMHENPASRPTLDAVLEMPYFNVENGFLSEQQMADELKNLGLLKEPDTPRPSFSGIAE